MTEWRGEPREIAIVRLSALGDVVHTLPLANGLRRAYPEARITWIVQPVPGELLRHHPAVDETIHYRRRRGRQAWRSLPEIARALRGRRFDLVVAPQVALKAGLVTALTRAPVRVGFHRKRSPELAWLFSNRHVPPAPVGHIQDDILRFLTYLGIDPEPVEWRITLTDEELERQRAFYAPLGRPVCAIVVASSRPEKDWPPERTAQVVDALATQYGMPSVLVGGPAPAERDAAERVVQAARHPPVNALGDDVRRLIYLIAGADLVISPDSGPLHLARALDVPVVGLYGYTNPKRWGPYRAFTDLVADGFARYPGEAYAVDAPPRPDGMGRITVEMVLDRVRHARERYGVGRPAAERHVEGRA